MKMIEERDTSWRRHRIATQLKQSGSVGVAALAREFEVSTQTIRKDLNYLTGRGIAARTYGGAIVAELVDPKTETTVGHKQTIRIRQKESIGRLAAAMVRPGDAIILDSGTTTLQIARFLPDDSNITVVTNDYGILAELAERPGIEVILLGGRLRRKNMAFYGAQTEESISELAADKLFLGVDGFDMERGITTYLEAEASLNRRMASVARQIIAVTDSAKFGQVCLHRILDAAEIDVLITDSEAPAYIQQAGTERPFDVLIAS